MSVSLERRASANGSSGEGLRADLLAGLPVTDRRLEVAGISTAWLEGGHGPTIVLLHGPGEHGAKWLRVLPALVKSYRVVVPDLPGCGASAMPDEGIQADHVLAWLRTLIDRTCASPPVIVAQIVGGAIAVRFASRHNKRLSQLVLVDTLGLAPFEPAPEFGQALGAFMANPTGETHDGLWRYCAFDLDRLHKSMDAAWNRVRAYNLKGASGTALRATQGLMEVFGLPAIPPAELEGITVPTTLIWGRHDLATRLAVAEGASKRYGWPLHIVEGAGDDPPIEQPEAFLQVLGIALNHS